MRITRLVAGAVSVGLLGLAPVALSAPAEAAVTVTTASTLTSTKNVYVYGERIFFDAAVTTTDPERPYAPGSATLYMMKAGSSAWEPVSSDDGVSYLYFTNVKARSNALYKVVYPGGTDTYDGDVFLPSESLPFELKTTRKVTIGKAKAKLTIKGKVAPKYKKKKVKIQIKKGKKYVKYRTIKTNKKSKFQVRLPAPRRGGKLFFKITVPGNKQFQQYSEVWYTYSYRSAITPRPAVKG